MSDSVNRGSTLPGGARRRYLTILFSDLSDSTALAAAMEAEDYGNLLATLRAAYHHVISKHGGTVVRIQGDGVLAIFGYPEAGEEDGRHATEAGLELHEFVAALNIDPPLPAGFALSLHSGVHSGLVLVDEGDVVRGRFELLGNAPNIAARLSDAAQSGEILVSEETLGPANHFFLTGERRPLQLKGRADPIHVYRILGHAPVNTRFEARVQRGLVPFIGRQRELELLQRNLAEVVAGQPRYLAICAPPGLGKTRLSEEFLQRAVAMQAQVHRGYCESYLSAEPLQPFLQMLRSLCELGHGMPAAAAIQRVEQTLNAIDPRLLSRRAEWLRMLSLSDAPGPAGSDVPTAPRASPEETTAALRDLFDSLSAVKPLVLFLDDWQWADDASRQVLQAIRGLSSRPILVLTGTRRFEGVAADMTDAQILDLAPLSDAEATQTVARWLPRSDPFVAAEICRYAGGSPLFIEELCHSVAHANHLPSPGAVRGGAAWLEALIESRVARLPPAQVDLVRAAAVIGNVVPCWLLERLTGLGENHPLVHSLAEQDFVFPSDQPGTLRFKHGIARDVIYNAVGLHQRQAMHLVVADALREQNTSLAEEEIYDALAYHYGAGGKAEESARFAELAGDKAMATSALDRAQAQYRAALTALDRLEPSRANQVRWNSIARRLGLASVFDPSRDHLDVLRKAVSLAAAHDDADALAQAEYWLGYAHFGLGDSRLAIHHCKQALQAARQAGDNPFIVQVRATLGQAHAAACDYASALPLLEEAIAVKRRHRSGARPAVGLSFTLTCKASILGDQGLFALAHECFADALEIVRGADHEVEGSLHSWRSAVYLWQGRWDDAHEAALAAQRTADRVRSLYLFAMGKAMAAYARWMTTRTPSYIQSIVDATSWIETRHRGQYISLNHGWLADAQVVTGRFGEARRAAAQALTRARMHDRLGQPMAYRALAQACTAQNDAAGAQHYLALAIRAARARGSPHEIAATQLCQAELAATRSQRAIALGLLDEATAAFDAMGMAWHQAHASEIRRQL